MSSRNSERCAVCGAGFGAGDEISFYVESQNANVSFIAGVEEFTLAVGRDREDLSLSPVRVKSAVRSEREIQIYVLGSKKTDFSPEAETR